MPGEHGPGAGFGAPGVRAPVLAELLRATVCTELRSAHTQYMPYNAGDYYVTSPHSIHLEPLSGNGTKMWSQIVCPNIF